MKYKPLDNFVENFSPLPECKNKTFLWLLVPNLSFSLQDLWPTDLMDCIKWSHCR
jgi:hypothetical protein